MKQITILLGGVSDRPVKELNGKTPLEAADTPCLDSIAKTGGKHFLQIADETFSTAANGRQFGRAFFEADYFGIPLKEEDTALCCQFVTLSDEEHFEDKTLLSVCETADEAEVRQTVAYLAENINNEVFQLAYGGGTTHILVWKNGEPNPGTLNSPYMAQGRKIVDWLPGGEFAAPLCGIMKKSCDLLKNHQMNGIWLYGSGKRPQNLSRQNGRMIADTPFACGIGKTQGLSVVHRDFEHLAQAAIAAISKTADTEETEKIYIHTALAEKGGLSGDFSQKVKGIEKLDKALVKPIVSFLGTACRFRRQYLFNAAPILR